MMLGLFRRGSVAAAVAVWSLAIVTPASPSKAAEIFLNGLALGSGNVSVHVESWRAQKFKSTFHQEYDFSCGSAALATLLNYSYKISATEQEVFKGMFAHGNRQQIEERGFSLLDMKLYLASRNLPSAGYRAPLAKIAGVGVPGIVLINERGYRHFVVLRGIQDGWVLLSDPSVGMRSEPVAVFRKEWSGIFFAILKHVNVAQASYNRPQDWKTAPPPPIGLARYAVDLAILELQTGIPNNFRF
jgi:uncharacterized protein